MSRPQLNSKETIGIYGKLPTFGDFVVRQLGSEFVNCWDEWLQNGLANSHSLLGETWLNFYLVSPIWRFVVGTGIIGNSAWIGIVVPSVDRVGRYFPLTFAQPISSDIDITNTYLANSVWFQLLETLGAEALSKDLNFAEFELKLREFPQPAEVIDNYAGDDTIPAFEKVFLSSFFCLLPDKNDSDFNILVREAISVSLKPASLWGTVLFDSQEHILLATEALPSKERFCALLDKKFEAHGWNDALSQVDKKLAPSNDQLSVDKQINLLG